LIVVVLVLGGVAKFGLDVFGPEPVVGAGIALLVGLYGLETLGTV